MLRRLYHDQPETFTFTPANQAWAEAQITKYPEGRQASAVIPLLWRAQEQEGWVTRPAIEEVARMLDMAYIRVLEVATFYFMFQLQPVGSAAHVQICGTTSCMICGAEDLIGVCRDEIAANPHELSPDGKLSWEEVECLGACANAPMAQIGKDYYEDLTTDGLRQILRDFAAGKVPVPGSQKGRFAAEPASGLTSLQEAGRGEAANASVALANAHRDTVKRIDGTEVALVTPWLRDGPAAQTDASEDAASASDQRAEGTAEGRPEATHGKTAVEGAAAQPEAEAEVAKADAAAEPQNDAAAETEAPAKMTADEVAAAEAEADKLSEAAADITAEDATRPAALDGPRDGTPDDLKMIKGVGPKLEKLLHSLGFYHFDQVGNWTPAEIAWVDRNLDGFKGRVIRDRWVAQARILAGGGQTEFSKRAKY